MTEREEKGMHSLELRDKLVILQPLINNEKNGKAYHQLLRGVCKV